MRIEAFAKINWALRITARRPNGYHELDMLMQAIDLSDTIDIEKADKTELFTNGERDEWQESNLIYKAVKALDVDARINIIKRIPSRAGLGGGSSDCAATLIAVNDLCGLGHTKTELCKIGAKLGADVPFFIYGGFAEVSGIGEVIRTYEKSPAAALVIFKVGEGLSTPEVYKQFDAMCRSDNEPLPPELITLLQNGEFIKAQQLYVNDLQVPAEYFMPGISRAIQRLKNSGAVYAGMSGSGSAVFGTYETYEQAQGVAEGIEGALAVRTK